MLDGLITYLIKEQSCLHINKLDHEHITLVEFFDQVLISADDPRLYLFKKADELTDNDISTAVTFSFDIVKNKSGISGVKYQTLIFIVFENGITPQRAKEILELDSFKKRRGVYPVIADGKSSALYYKLPYMEIEFEILLDAIKTRIKKAAPSSLTVSNAPDMELDEALTIGRMESFRRAITSCRPYITWFLIAANLLIFLFIELQEKSSESGVLLRYGAKASPLIWQGELWRLVTPAFLHIGFMHLFSNCVIIFIVGQLLEAVVGRWRLAFIYLISGIIGNLLSVRFSPYLSAGASSAVFGILGAIVTYGWMYKKLIPRNFYKIIFIYLLPFLVYNLIIGFLSSNIDVYAHIGGLAGGVLSILILGTEYPPLISRKLRWGAIAAFTLIFAASFMAAMRPYNDAYKVYYYVLGTTAAAEGRMTDAVNNIEMSLSYDSKYNNARDILGRIYFTQGIDYLKQEKYDAALKKFENASKNIEIKSENFKLLSHVYELLGRCYDEKYQPREALRNYLVSLVFNPKSRQVSDKVVVQYILIARKEFLEGNLQSSKFAAEMAGKYEESPGDSKIMLGDIYYSSGDFLNSALAWGEVKDEAKKSGAQERLRIYIFKNLWYLPENKQKFAEETKAEKLISDGEKLILNSGNYEKALALFEQAILLSPDDPAPYIVIARVKLLLGDPASALDMAEKAEKLANASGYAFEAKLVKARINMMMKNIEQAQTDLKKCIAQKPYIAEPYAMAGVIYLQGKKYKDAENNLKKAVELNPENVLWRIELARFYKIRGNQEEFFKQANEAIGYAESQGRFELEICIRGMLKKE